MTIDETALIMDAFVAIGTIALACATFYSIKNLRDQYKINHIRELLSEVLVIINDYLFYYQELNNNIQLRNQVQEGDNKNKNSILKDLSSTISHLVDQSEKSFREFSRIEIILKYSNIPDPEFKETAEKFINCHSKAKNLFTTPILTIENYINYINGKIYTEWIESLNNLMNTCIKLKQTKFC
ncbi:hypothetical protein [Dehalococcoides sp.]|uniref:hypothetical protein n=1 Tax=Dehalococcoides sp. TaxID=1966486 RepID=UPI002ACB12DA|nr:hypothetical protein [Dehalococcoides sp.]